MKASVPVSGGPANGKKHQLDHSITLGAKVMIDGKPYIFTQVNGVPTLKYDPS